MVKGAPGAQTRSRTASTRAAGGENAGGPVSISAPAGTCMPPHAAVAAVIEEGLQGRIARIMEAAMAEVMQAIQEDVAAAAAAAVAAQAAAAAAKASAEAAAMSAASAATVHNRPNGTQPQPSGGEHTAGTAPTGGDPAKQVVVRMPSSTDAAGLRQVACAAVAAAAECDPACIDGTHVLYKGRAAREGSLEGLADQRTRQAVVMVYVRHAPIAAAAVRHSSRLANMADFQGVFIAEALNVEQKRLKAAFWRRAPELRAAIASREPIQWRQGVPHRRVAVGRGRYEWQAMALPQE